MSGVFKVDGGSIGDGFFFFGRVNVLNSVGRMVFYLRVKSDEDY